MTITDCLVLHIASTSGPQLFIIYDCKTGLYEIRGKNVSESLDYAYFNSYSFSCEKVKHLSEFIDALFFDSKINENKNKIITLYNCDELPETSEDITFEFLTHHLGLNNEIFFKFYKKLSKKKCKKLLKMMKHIYNEY